MKMYGSTEEFLHEKGVILDDLYAAIGTAHFDNRPFRLNFEATSIVVDKAFVAPVAAVCEDDMRPSHDVSSQRASDLAFWRRIGSRIARLFSPTL